MTISDKIDEIADYNIKMNHRCKYGLSKRQAQKLIEECLKIQVQKDFEISGSKNLKIITEI